MNMKWKGVIDIKMKHARIVGKREFTVETVEFPPVKGSPVIQVKHCGVCGSDVHYWEFGDTMGKDLVLGHEYTGIVVDPGNTDLQVGDHVLGYTQNPNQDPCGVCEACLKGDPANCTNRVVNISIGCHPTHPGAYSEYITWYPGGFILLPKDVPLDHAALVEPISVALHAVELSGIRAGSKVLVLGGGIIGCAITEWCRAFGATVISQTELNPVKAEIVRGFGLADKVYAADAPDLEEQLLAAAPGGYDIVFDMLALSKPLNMALKLLHRDGVCVMVGVNFNKEILVDVFETVVFQKRIQGSKGHTPDCFRASVRAIQSGVIKPEKYITGRCALEDVQTVFERISDANLDFKVLIDF